MDFFLLFFISNFNLKFKNNNLISPFLKSVSAFPFFFQNSNNRPFRFLFTYMKEYHSMILIIYGAVFDLIHYKEQCLKV